MSDITVHLAIVVFDALVVLLVAWLFWVTRSPWSFVLLIALIVWRRSDDGDEEEA